MSSEWVKVSIQAKHFFVVMILLVLLKSPCVHSTILSVKLAISSAAATPMVWFEMQIIRGSTANLTTSLIEWILFSSSPLSRSEMDGTAVKKQATETNNSPSGMEGRGEKKMLHASKSESSNFKFSTCF